jgi:hypothetical protein
MDIATTPLPPQSTLVFSKANMDVASDVDILPDDFIVQPSKSAEDKTPRFSLCATSLFYLLRHLRSYFRLSLSSLLAKPRALCLSSLFALSGGVSGGL